MTERHNHIERGTECIFCKIIQGIMPGNIVADKKKALAIVSLEGHPLIIPKVHVDSQNVGEHLEDMLDVYRLANLLIPHVMNVYSVNSVNLLENRGPHSGQEIPHLHMHVIPRNRGDKLVKVRINLMDQDKRNILGQMLKDSLKLEP